MRRHVCPAREKAHTSPDHAPHIVIAISFCAHPALRDGNALTAFCFFAGSSVVKRQDELVLGAQSIGANPSLFCIRCQCCQRGDASALAVAHAAPEGETTTPTRSLILAMRDERRGVPRLKVAP
jgi:hypothetical protein